MLVDLLPEGPQPALIDGDTGEACSFAELRSSIEQVAAVLQPFAGGFAVLLMENRLPHAVAYLACLSAGLAVALVDPAIDEDRLEAACAAHEPDVVIGSRRPSREAWVPLDLPWVAAEVEAWSRRSSTEDPVYETLAVCLSTSGTTGSPKFVRLSHENLVSNARSICSALGIASGEVALAHLPLHYSYGLSVLNSHLLAGSTVVLTGLSALRPGFLELIARYGVTTIPNVPFGFTLFDRIGFAKADLPSVNILTQAGGRLPADTADRYHELMTRRGGSLHVMYGQTEGTARLSILHSDDYRMQRGSVGRAVPGGSFEIVDPDRSGRGLVRYRGPNVMLGYAEDRAGLSRGDEMGGVLDTGDAGRLDGDVLTVMGRVGRVAKLFGLRFDLDDVERLAARFGTVAVLEGNDELLVFAERHSDEQCSALSRALAVELRLPPKAIRVVPIVRLPRSAAGKIAYAQLRQNIT